jgi:asparagine synthase (glutamine-hydrolysing)
MMIFDPDHVEEFFDPSFVQAGGPRTSQLLLDAFDRTDAQDFVDALLDVDVNHYLSDCLLVKVDIATMAHGLEGRSPMLDHEVMEFAAALPADLKLRGDTTKYIFKEAVRDLLPAEIIDRPKKGFSVPLKQWFRGELREMSADLLLDGRLGRRGYFKPGAVQRMLEEHWRGAHDWENQLWTLLMFESWHRMFIDERPTAASAPNVAAVGA